MSFFAQGSFSGKREPECCSLLKLAFYSRICRSKISLSRHHLNHSRKGHSLTERFPELRRISVKASTAVLDGEVVALGQDGKPCFEGLHGRTSEVACVIVFFAFDLLYLDGYDLTQCPLVARKAALKRILPKGDTARIRYTEHFLGSGKRLFSAIEKMQLEGMVAKRKDSVYSRGRSRLWQKVKTTAGRDEMQKRIETWGK